jgi:hypothetical protein
VRHLPFSSNALSLSAVSATIDVEEEKLLEGGHLVIECSLNKVRSHALVDCGATGLAFIDENFARQHHWDLIPLHEYRDLEVIDGCRISSGAITHIVKLPFSIGDHGEERIAFVTNLGHYQLVLRIPWLRHHDVSIRFATNTITFDSPACMGHRQEPIVVKGIEDIESLVSSHRESIASSTASPVLDPSVVNPTKPSIAIISAASLRRLAKNKDQRYGNVQTFSLSLYKINKALDRKTIEQGDLKSLVPHEFHEFLPLFDKVVAD